MTLGLDTSVVLRLLTGQPVAQLVAAKERLERAGVQGEAVVVTDLVIAEAYYALQDHYGFTKERARTGLRALARSGAVTLSPPDALAALEPAVGAGVVDRLIHVRHHRERATTLTFDRKLAALDGAIRLR